MRGTGSDFIKIKIVHVDMILEDNSAAAEDPVAPDDRQTDNVHLCPKIGGGGDDPNATKHGKLRREEDSVNSEQNEVDIKEEDTEDDDTVGTEKAAATATLRDVEEEMNRERRRITDLCRQAEIRFELEEPCGTRSIVIVSPQTLIQLGILPVIDDDGKEEEEETRFNTDNTVNVEDIKEEPDSDDEDGDSGGGGEYQKSDRESGGDYHHNGRDSYEEDQNNTESNREWEEKDAEGNREGQNVDDGMKQSGAPTAAKERSVTEGSTKVDPVQSLPRKGRGIKYKRYVYDHIIVLKTEAVWKCLKCETEFSKNRRQRHIFCNPANGRNPYMCSHCSKPCINGSHLAYHLRSQHTGEAPFKSKVCSKRFVQKTKLNRHMRVHKCKETRKTRSADKSHRPHKCPEPGCDGAFSTAKDVRRHFLKHTREQPFECTVCGNEYGRKDNFERHLRQTHQLPEPTRKAMSKEALEKYENSKKGRRILFRKRRYLQTEVTSVEGVHAQLLMCC